MAKKEKKIPATPEIKDIKLNSLLEITKAINNNFSTPKLLEIYEKVLKEQLNIGKIILFSFDREWKCILKYGVENEYKNINVEKDLVKIKEISIIDYSGDAVHKSFEIAIPVFHKSQPLAYVLIGDLEDKVELSPTIKHLPFIQTITNIIIVAIENKKLAKDNIRQEGIKKELELASQMQNMLFPRVLPDDASLETAAMYLPHHEVGGDYYDFIKLTDHEVAFCIADVSGKGISAALLMANFQANLRALFNHTTSLTELVKDLNSKVIASANGEKFITLFIARYNLVTRIFHYINAGHNPPVILNGNSVSLLKVGCTGLGMFDELTKVKEGIISMEPGSVVVCYTDGLVEIENEKSENFGIEPVMKIVKNNPEIKMKSLIDSIIDSAKSFNDKKAYPDDIALLAFRIH
jgi:phosphoserine phosphatase RsbU/P